MAVSGRFTKSLSHLGICVQEYREERAAVSCWLSVPMGHLEKLPNRELISQAGTNAYRMTRICSKNRSIDNHLSGCIIQLQSLICQVSTESLFALHMSTKGCLDGFVVRVLSCRNGISRFKSYQWQKDFYRDWKPRTSRFSWEYVFEPNQGNNPEQTQCLPHCLLMSITGLQ